MAELAQVGDADFDQEVLRADRPVVVDFWAPWCGPCRVVNPILSDLADEHGGRIKFVKLNVDTNPETQARYSILSIPTVMVFVQSLRGLSHTKLEDTKEEHLELAVAALDRLASKTIAWVAGDGGRKQRHSRCSLPNSVWQRTARNSVSRPNAKRSFASTVPKQSLGTR